MSYFTKARGPWYYNDLLTGSEADFMKLITKYSIHPPDEIAGYKGKTLGQIDPSTSPTVVLNRRTNDVRMARVEKNKKVGYINLSLKPRGDITTTGNEGGDHIYFDSTFDHNQVVNGYVPVWFLPWDTSGASIRLTIPQAGTGAGPNNDDPNVFFTAAINGCSIFFQGTVQNPTIYHCGGTTGYGDTELDEAAQFWAAVVDEFIDVDQNRGKKGRPEDIERR